MCVANMVISCLSGCLQMPLNMGYPLGSMWLLEDGPHERALIANETPCFFVVTHSGLTFWVTASF